MKKCRICATTFEPARPLQRVCSPPCAIKHTQALAAKAQAKAEAIARTEIRARLDALQTKPQLVAKAQAAFNAFVRARDAGKPCISCGKPLSAEANTYDCGHYRSVGSAPHMRFVEDNAHGQCKHCNSHLAGNHVEYRRGLIERIGLAEVERIERDQVVRKYTREGLVEIARHYRAEARRVLGDRGAQ